MNPVWNQETAICWLGGRTVGNIAVASHAVTGHFPAQAGKDGLLACEFVRAGKFRHGADREWCRSHQTYWGTKADLHAYQQLGEMRCANHTQPVNYIREPLQLDLTDYAEVGLFCSLPPGLASQPIQPRPPKLYGHLRAKAPGSAFIEIEEDAIAVRYHPNLGLFANPEITSINITPPAALEFVCAVEENRELTCISCARCGYPHLDLGEFARKPHRKHFCGNCGWDHTWSLGNLVSTPLKPLHDRFTSNLQHEEPNKALNLDLEPYSSCDYRIWASTPAILWFVDRPQQRGIHVHVWNRSRQIVQDIFRSVTLNGQTFGRKGVLQMMLERTVL